MLLALACTSESASLDPVEGSGGTGGAAGGGGLPGVGGAAGGGGGAHVGKGGTGGEEVGCWLQPDRRTEKNPDSLIGEPCFAESLPEDQRWIVDPELWTLLDFGVPEEEPAKRCHLYEANLDHFEAEPLRWESCGAACEKASPWQGLGARKHVLEGRLHTYRTSDGGATVFSSTHHWGNVGVHRRHLLLHYRRFLDGREGGYAMLMDSFREGRSSVRTI